MKRTIPNMHLVPKNRLKHITGLPVSIQVKIEQTKVAHLFTRETFGIPKVKDHSAEAQT